MTFYTNIHDSQRMNPTDVGVGVVDICGFMKYLDGY